MSMSIGRGRAAAIGVVLLAVGGGVLLSSQGGRGCAPAAETPAGEGRGQPDRARGDERGLSSGAAGPRVPPVRAAGEESGPVGASRTKGDAGDAIEPLAKNADVKTIFESGAALVDKNSGESLGASREELEAGVQRIEDALRRGYPNRARAYEELSAAYNALKSRPPATEAERQAFNAKEGEMYQRLMELEPGRPDWAMGYVSTISDKEQVLEALKDAARRHPKYAPGQLSLGEILCERGSRVEGVAHIADAARSVESGDEETRNSIIIAAHRCGGDAGAQKVKSILKGARVRNEPGAE